MSKITFLLVIFLSSCNINSNDDIKHKVYKKNHTIYEISLKKGVANGLAIFFYENGSIKASGYFKDGLADGKWVRYFEDTPSTISVIENYKNGKRNGVMYKFYSSGYLDVISNFREDTMCCEFTKFYDKTDKVHLFYPWVEPNGDVYKYIEYDLTGEPHYLADHNDKPTGNYRLTLKKIDLTE